MGRWFHVSQNDVYWEDPHFVLQYMINIYTNGKMISCQSEWCLLGRPALVLQYMINIYNNGKMISCQSEWCLLGRPTLVLQYMINIYTNGKMISCQSEWCLLGRPTLVLQYMINICTNGKMISCQSEWCLLGRPTLVLIYIYPGYIHISGQLEGHILYYYMYLIYKPIDRRICWYLKLMYHIVTYNFFSSDFFDKFIRFKMSKYL
jgi:hypothetical protein